MRNLAVSYGDSKVRTAARHMCKADALSASKGGYCIMIGLLALACGGSCGGARSVHRHHTPAPIGVASFLSRPVLRLRGGTDAGGLTEEDIGHLGLDGIDDDEVLLAGNEDDTDDPSVTPGGLLDLTDDGGVMKALLVPGWKSPLLGFGDEISISVLGREAKPNGTVFLNRTEANPLVFRYGKKEVVTGLEVAVASMKLGERAVFIVRKDYAYGDDSVWRGVAAGAAVEFEIEVLCWGDRDLSNGKGGVLFKELDNGCGWDQPSPKDEVLVSVRARRSVDGEIIADSHGPQWLCLSSGLLPRGLALAITEMSQDMKAQAVISGAYIFSDRQLQAAAEEWVQDTEDLLEPSPFFSPNNTFWLTERTFFPNNTLHVLGVANLQVGGGRKGTYVYTIHLHSFNRVLDVGLSPAVQVEKKSVDVASQEQHIDAMLLGFVCILSTVSNTGSIYDIKYSILCMYCFVYILSAVSNTGPIYVLSTGETVRRRVTRVLSKRLGGWGARGRGYAGVDRQRWIQRG